MNPKISWGEHRNEENSCKNLTKVQANKELCERCPDMASDEIEDSQSHDVHGMSMKSGIVEESVCPFSAISAILEDRKAQQNLKTLGSLKAGIDEGEDMLKPLPHAPSANHATSLPLQCPMSGRVGVNQTMPQIGQSSHDHSDKASLRSGSRAQSVGSREQGTLMGRSQVSSRRSSRKGGRPRVRRVKKLTGYSVWEAQTYIPILRASWTKILSKNQPADIGLKVYSAMFAADADVQRIFVKPQEIMGAKFGQILQSLMANVEDPVALYEHLKGLAPMHVERGVNAHHLPVMASAILQTVENELGEAFTLDTKSAWEWLWNWVSETLLQTMEEVRNGHTVISRSWDMALDNYDELELAELLYDTLFEIAPNLQHVYSKPKQVMAVKFVDLLSTLVSFHGDTVRWAPTQDVDSRGWSAAVEGCDRRRRAGASWLST